MKINLTEQLEVENLSVTDAVMTMARVLDGLVDKIEALNRHLETLPQPATQSPATDKAGGIKIPARTREAVKTKLVEFIEAYVSKGTNPSVIPMVIINRIFSKLSTPHGGAKELIQELESEGRVQTSLMKDGQLQVTIETTMMMKAWRERAELSPLTAEHLEDFLAQGLSVKEIDKRLNELANQGMLPFVIPADAVKEKY